MSKDVQVMYSAFSKEINGIKKLNFSETITYKYLLGKSFDWCMSTVWSTSMNDDKPENKYEEDEKHKKGLSTEKEEANRKEDDTFNKQLEKQCKIGWWNRIILASASCIKIPTTIM